MFSVTILYLIATCLLYAIALEFSGDILIPNNFVVLRKAYNALCKSSSGQLKTIVVTVMTLL
jgi:hypothetical protein